MSYSNDEKAVLALQYSNCNELNNILLFMEKSLGKSEQPDNSKIIHVQSGANLYLIAAEEYGNPLLWTTIAQANNLSDPEVNIEIDLVIPPDPGSARDTGGVLNA